MNIPFSADFYVKWRKSTTTLDAFEYQVPQSQWVNIDDNGGFFDANVSSSINSQQVFYFHKENAHFLRDSNLWKWK